MTNREMYFSNGWVIFDLSFSIKKPRTSDLYFPFSSFYILLKVNIITQLKKYSFSNNFYNFTEVSRIVRQLSK